MLTESHDSERKRNPVKLLGFKEKQIVEKDDGLIKKQIDVIYQNGNSQFQQLAKATINSKEDLIWEVLTIKIMKVYYKQKFSCIDT